MPRSRRGAGVGRRGSSSPSSSPGGAAATSLPPGAMTLPGDDARVPAYKLVLVGDGGVGKSALTIQFVQQQFCADYDPTIEDNYHKHWEVDGQVCKLNVVDTAGQEEYSAMREQYLSKGDGFLLVYSVTDPESFHHVAPHRTRIVQAKRGGGGGQEASAASGPPLPMVLVANKVDLSARRRVSQDEGVQLARELGGIPYIETSAMDPPLNIEESFRVAVRQIRGSRNPRENKERKKCSIM